MLEPVNAWTKLLCLTMIALTTGCAIGPSAEAICDGTDNLRTQHAAALIEDGGPQSKRSGVALIATIDAGCG